MNLVCYHREKATNYEDRICEIFSQVPNKDKKVYGFSNEIFPFQDSIQNKFLKVKTFK